MDFYLGIDIGTSRVKAVLFDQHFTAAPAPRKTPPRLSANGYAEQDMTQLWHSVLAILRQIARHPALQAGRLRAIGLAGQGEGSGSAMRRANRWGRGSCGAIPAATS
jgi:xylulokinase